MIKSNKRVKRRGRSNQINKLSHTWQKATARILSFVECTHVAMPRKERYFPISPDISNNMDPTLFRRICIPFDVLSLASSVPPFQQLERRGRERETERDHALISSHRRFQVLCYGSCFRFGPKSNGSSDASAFAEFWQRQTAVQFCLPFLIWKPCIFHQVICF